MSDPLQALARASRAGAVSSLIGALFVFGAVGFGYAHLRKLRVETDSLKDEHTRLQGDVTRLRGDLDHLEQEKVKREKQVEELGKMSEKLNANIDELKKKVRPSGGDLVKQLTWRTKAVPTPKVAGEDLFHFYVWCDAPDDVLKQIGSVKYEPINSKIESRVADPGEHGQFAMRYTGWGCVKDLRITVTLKDGRVLPPNDFAMCDQLGW